MAFNTPIPPDNDRLGKVMHEHTSTCPDCRLEAPPRGTVRCDLYYEILKSELKKERYAKQP